MGVNFGKIYILNFSQNPDGVKLANQFALLVTPLRRSEPDRTFEVSGIPRIVIVCFNVYFNN